jgi:hypothetical protein
MRQQISKNKLIVGTLVSAVALPVGAIGGAGSASATCFGAFGIDIGEGCTSSLTTIAIGIGDAAVANAGNGFLGAAIALGNNTTATIGEGGFLNAAIAAGLANGDGETTTADTLGNLNFAYAGGPMTSALTRGNLAVAFVQGSQADAAAGGPPNDFANVSVNFGNGLAPGTNNVRSAGSINLAANLGGNGTLNNPANVQAIGIFNNAINLGGSQNSVRAGDTTRAVFSSASNFFGINNNVSAGPGPAAVASAFGSTGPVTQNGPGININNFSVGGEAASSSTQASRLRPSLDFSRNGNNAASRSVNTSSLGGLARESVSDRITREVKRLSDKVTERRAAHAETAAADTSDE